MGDDETSSPDSLGESMPHKAESNGYGNSFLKQKLLRNHSFYSFYRVKKL